MNELNKNWGVDIKKGIIAVNLFFFFFVNEIINTKANSMEKRVMAIYWISCDDCKMAPIVTQIFSLYMWNNKKPLKSNNNKKNLKCLFSFKQFQNFLNKNKVFTQT